MHDVDFSRLQFVNTVELLPALDSFPPQKGLGRAQMLCLIHSYTEVTYVHRYTITEHINTQQSHKCHQYTVCTASKSIQNILKVICFNKHIH